jgi:hypothetical protein
VRGAATADFPFSISHFPLNGFLIVETAVGRVRIFFKWKMTIEKWKIMLGPKGKRERASQSRPINCGRQIACTAAMSRIHFGFGAVSSINPAS